MRRAREAAGRHSQSHLPGQRDCSGPCCRLTPPAPLFNRKIQDRLAALAVRPYRGTASWQREVPLSQFAAAGPGQESGQGPSQG